MIYIDPTEARDNSRLPKDVQKASTSLDHLEQVTGADILVTTYEIVPIITNPDLCLEVCSELQGKLMNASKVRIKRQFNCSLLEAQMCIDFWKACQLGALVQRKSGRDFLGSITKMDDIVFRMRAICMDDSWMLMVGDYKKDKQDHVIVNGRSTQWGWESFEGAQISWQARGGKFQWLYKDALVLGWLRRLESHLEKIQKEPFKVVSRTPNQFISKWDGIHILTAIQGIGEKKAHTAMELFGNPARAIEMLTNPSALEEYPDIMRKLGIAKKSQDRIRKMIMGDEELNKLVVKPNDYE